MVLYVLVGKLYPGSGHLDHELSQNRLDMGRSTHAQRLEFRVFRVLGSCDCAQQEWRQDHGALYVPQAALCVVFVRHSAYVINAGIHLRCTYTCTYNICIESVYIDVYPVVY